MLKGESLGLIVRIRTARATARAIEVNAGARYAKDHRVTYLRCHITDVTEKVRSERELRLRTRELTQVNGQLRKINRELEELKNRYAEINQSLARANAELSLKNRELDEFVYVVSHDLQEPLRTMTAFSDFLLKDHAPRLDREGSEYVLHLRDASRRMRAMIHGLLNLSRAGKVLDESGPVDLGELAQLVQADLRELIRSRGAEVRVRVTGAVLWGDRRRLQQLLANLVSNGIKYNRSEVPCVEIGTSESASHPRQPGSWLTFFVRDNGIGVEPRHHQRIFQLFRRLHSQDEFEGTGVGLAICNKIVRAHGGEICLDSVPGKGTAFYVHLPSGSAPAPGSLHQGATPEAQVPTATDPGPGGQAFLREP